MEFSTLFKRQLGLVYQERIEDEKVLITGEGLIIPYLVAELCFLGIGTSQGVIAFPKDLKVSKDEIKGQNLLLPKDEGKFLWEAINHRIRDRIAKEFIIEGVSDLDTVNWDSTVVAYSKNIEDACIIPKFECPIYATTSRSAAYIGTEPVLIEESGWNVLKPSLAAIAAGFAAQEVLRRNLLIRPSEFLASDLEMRYVIQRNNIYKECVEFHKQHKGLPFNARIKLGGESVPTQFEPVYEEVKSFDGKKEKIERRINPNQVIIRVGFPADSYLNRVIYNLVELLDRHPLEHYKFTDSLLVSPYQNTRIEDGKIIDAPVKIPSSLKNKKIFFLGVGGIGSWATTLINLSNTKTCKMIIEDLDDRVEEHNLNRQILFDHSSIGIPKARAAKTVLEKMNPSNEIISLEFELEIGTANNILNEEYLSLEEYLEKLKTVKFIPGTNIPSEVLNEDLVIANEIYDSDIIIAGPDNIRTRYITSLISKMCNTPLVSAGGERFEGKVDLFLPEGDCYVCRYGESSKHDEKVVSCTGELPTPSIVTTISIIGGLQSAIALAMLIDPKQTEPLHHFLQYYGRYQMIAACQGEACKHKKKTNCPEHLNLAEWENPFKFF